MDVRADGSVSPCESVDEDGGRVRPRKMKLARSRESRAARIPLVILITAVSATFIWS